MGFVSLVGAGCGGAELITVKGLDCLRRADCLLYDHLAAPELLTEVKPGCEMLYVGKQAGRHALPQGQLQELLAQKAAQHPYVVRLKGGDPFVFGRGGEEAAFLKARGIPFEVVPGISSALGGLACAGIPVTHRGVARGFRVMTASDKEGGLTHLDFASMSHTEDTLVFLMGRRRVGQLTRALLEAGKPPDTPAALISQAACPGQALIQAPLSQLADRAKDACLPDPALIAVGPAVALQPQMDFWHSGPLAGRRLAVAQTGQGPTALAFRLRQLGAQVTLLPVSRLAPLPGALDGVDFGRYTWLLLSSKNAVDFFMEALAGRGLDLRALGGVKIAAIGAETARRLRHWGIFADLVPQSFDSDGLYKALAPRLGERDAILFPRVKDGPPALPRRLAALCPVDEPALYELLPLPAEPLSAAFAAAQPQLTLFTCASGARLLLEAVGGAAGLGESLALAIGPQTGQALRQAGVAQVFEVEPYTYEGLVQKTLLLCGP